MTIRRATESDLDAMLQLYSDTIRTVNARDYTPEQIDAWASGGEAIRERFNEQEYFIAEINGEIVGFSSLYPNGYLDFMYVHKDFQSRGIATELLKTVEARAHELLLKEITSDVSITARPFFLKRGFEIERLYTDHYKGQEYENAKMKKTF
ncbi:MAG: GNAT family N-acetyltransferase [Bacteroidota bacterium]